MGKMLIFLGALVVAIGVVLMLASRLNLPLGRLPGDIIYRGRHTTFYFPLVTGLLLSIVLSGIMYFVGKAGR